MTKNDIAVELSKGLCTKKEAIKIVNRVFEAIKNSLKRGDKVVVTGFGSFKICETKIKKGRNPKTGEDLIIGPKKKIRFRQAKKNLSDDE
ncbi:MAG: HU family DNA-binding protein [Endomicrobium sp.]|nr:HU family DNA-binding protein [Endomicrobium sp.]